MPKLPGGAYATPGRCGSCRANLWGKPKVDVEGTEYCFCCAKKAVAQYESRRAEYENAHTGWDRKRKEYVERNEGPIWLVPPIVSLLLASILAGVFVLLGVIPGLGLSWTVSRWLSRRREEQYARISPEPTLCGTTPICPVVGRPKYFLLPPDGSSLDNGPHREQILRRDRFTCRKCEKRADACELEVHHILPKSKGGIDDPTNLVTLCLHCHDREDWFGHVRKFPTTRGVFSRYSAKMTSEQKDTGEPVSRPKKRTKANVVWHQSKPSQEPPNETRARRKAELERQFADQIVAGDKG